MRGSSKVLILCMSHRLPYISPKLDGEGWQPGHHLDSQADSQSTCLVHRKSQVQSPTSGLGMSPVWNTGELLPVSVDGTELDGPVVWFGLKQHTQLLSKPTVLRCVTCWSYQHGKQTQLLSASKLGMGVFIHFRQPNVLGQPKQYSSHQKVLIFGSFRTSMWNCFNNCAHMKVYKGHPLLPPL